ncbi:MAG: hypothetical protein ACR2IP_04500 [Solirubrobacteraceae bacterium]
MSVARYALGIGALALVCGSLALAALTLRRRFLPGFGGAPARLAESVIGLALLIVILQALGTVGLLGLGPVLVACALVGLGSILATGGGFAGIRAGGPSRHTGRRDAQTRASGAAFRDRAALALALLISAALVAEWAAPTLQSYDAGIHTFDSLWYHLPWAASFAQTGQITSLRFTDVEYLTAFYPATAELLHGLGIVLLARDTLSPALNLAWLGLTALAAYCIGRPRGLGTASLAGAALALATPMMSFSQAGSAANDVLGVFFLLAALALLANARGQRAPFVLAGLAAGLAVSVKLSLLAPVLALTIAVTALARPCGRRASAALWLAPLLLGGGFWYGRNLIAVGNPLPWSSLGILPTPAPPLQEHTAFSIAHYLGDPHLLGQVVGRVLEPGLAAGLGPWWPAILAGAVVGPLLCLLPGAQRHVRIAGLVALASLGAYLITPESAAGPAGNPLGFAFNLRYAAPALTLSLAVLPLTPVLGGARRRAATMLALAVVLVATLAQARLWPSRHLPGALGAGAIVLGLGLAPVALGLAGAMRRGRLGGRRDPGRPRAPRTARSRWHPLGLRARPSRRIAGLTVLAALVIAAGAAGYGWQRHYLHGRYAFQPGTSYLARVWARFREVHGARVGLVGTFGGFFSYPLLGLDDSNHVQYVARRGPHGSFTALATCRQWRRALDAGHYRFLLTTPARDPWRPKALQPSPEDTWTASDPAAHLLYTRRALGQPISMYELRGPLDPAGCS